ncbi:NYN domain-containing protein [Herbaspirillum sp. alder98]|uniref:NYN domain-containing protein n=1 Tax=Herbaspirillum sp. alder98 TaxID=2913096 RepID=UPI001CD87D42|nr:NYN domain-containing protein [Herbaspirillum sp. alder98]MCA1323802.1 NYN domain-containing protein [Herbaspirillum sp. alder98]
MDHDARSRSIQDRRIALLIDADNVSHTKIAAMLGELSRYGSANIRRAYGDWGSTSLKGWKDKLHEFAIRPVQQFSYSSGKNATDIALVIDAMELLYTQKPDAFCLASSDADFTPLVMQLKANGHDVYGFGERKTPKPFVNACTTFLYLDNLGDAQAPLADALEPVKPKGRATRGAKARAAEAVTEKPVEKTATKAPAGKSLAQDATLVTLLRGAVEAAAHEDGWAQMSAAGSAAKRQAPIDPRNYGVKNFPALFAATGLFEIVKGENGHSYVADKRNKDRAAKPVL